MGFPWGIKASSLFCTTQGFKNRTQSELFISDCWFVDILCGHGVKQLSLWKSSTPRCRGSLRFHSQDMGLTNAGLSQAEVDAAARASIRESGQQNNAGN